MPVHRAGYTGSSGHHSLIMFILALMCATVVQAKGDTDTIRFHSVALPQHEPATSHHSGATNVPEQSAMTGTRKTLVDFARFEEVVNVSSDISPEAQKKQIDTLSKRLNDQTALHGPYNPALLDTLSELADLHQAMDSHREAISLLERSEQIIRINKGLYHPQQVAIVDRIIHSLEASARSGEIEGRLKALLHLQQKAHGDRHINTVDARLRLGEWYLSRFNLLRRESLVQDHPDQLSFSNSNMQKKSAWNRLTQAQEQFVESINILTAARAYRHPDLMTLEQHLLETYYLHAYHLDQETDRHQLGDTLRQDPGSSTLRQAFLGGVHAHNRILDYLANNPDTTVTDYANHVAAKGDWYILFGNKNKAMETYQEAENLLGMGNIPADITRDILRPQVPVSVPATSLNPLNAEADDGYDGYVDVAFRVSRNGKAHRIKTIGSSADLAASVEHRLIQLVRKSRFRPHIQAGEAVDSGELQLRYYYTY